MQRVKLQHRHFLKSVSYTHLDVYKRQMIRCIGIEDLRARIQAAEDDKRNLAEKQEQCKKKVQELSASREEAQQKLIPVSYTHLDVYKRQR